MRVHPPRSSTLELVLQLRVFRYLRLRIDLVKSMDLHLYSKDTRGPYRTLKINTKLLMYPSFTELSLS